jgi:release factor glutamine methyltransferase
MSISREYQRAVKRFRLMGRRKKPYKINMFGKIIPVFPQVFSPHYFSDVQWFAKEVPDLVKQRSFLEIGTGTGVITLFVAMSGARRVVATDISAMAVSNAKETFRLHSLDIPVLCGDVFAPVPKTRAFDVIFWNHPFHYTEKRPKSFLLRGGFDYRYEGLHKFFKGAKSHLTKEGEVLLGTSKTARIQEILRIARAYGYTSKLAKSERISSVHRPGVFIDVRIYSFKPKRARKHIIS